jgi:hypothetical protein
MNGAISPFPLYLHGVHRDSVNNFLSLFSDENTDITSLFKEVM